MVEEVCFAIKADPLQVRRESDNANIIILKECLGYSRVVEYDLCKNIGDIYKCTEFEMLEVNHFSPHSWFLATYGRTLRPESLRYYQVHP